MNGLLLPVPDSPLSRAQIDMVMEDLALDIRAELEEHIAQVRHREQLEEDPDRDERAILEGETFIRATYVIALDRDHLLAPDDRDDLMAEAEFLLDGRDIPDLGPARSLDELFDDEE